MHLFPFQNNLGTSGPISHLGVDSAYREAGLARGRDSDDRELGVGQPSDVHAEAPGDRWREERFQKLLEGLLFPEEDPVRSELVWSFCLMRLIEAPLPKAHDPARAGEA